MQLTRVALVALKKRLTAQVVVKPKTYVEATTPLYLANWRNKIAVQTRWVTTVSVSPYSGETEAVALRSRPLITQQVTLTAHNEEQLNHLLSDLYQHGSNNSTRVPIYPDRVKVISASSSGSTVINAVTNLRRFFSGQNIILVPPGHEKITSTVWGTVQRIESISDTTITIDALQQDITAGWYIYPLFDAYPVVNYAGRMLTCDQFEAQVSFNEISGANSLPAYDFFQPTEFTEGIPMLQFKPNGEKSYGVGRYRFSEELTTPRTNHIHPFDMDSLYVGTLPFRFNSRAEYFEFHSFWDYVRGREKSFFITNFQKIISPVSYPNASTLAVEQLQTLDSLKGQLKYMSFEGDEDNYVIKVDDITSVGDKYHIHFTGDITTLNPHSIHAAIKVKSTRDSLQTSWENFNSCTANLEVREDA